MIYLKLWSYLNDELSVLLERVRSCISCLFLTNMNFHIPQLVLTRKVFNLWAPVLDVFPTSWVTGNKKVLNYVLQRSASLGLQEMHQVSSTANNQSAHHPSLVGPLFCAAFSWHMCPSFSVVSKSNLILPRALFAHKCVPHSFFCFTFKASPITKQMDYCRPSLLAVQISHQVSTF